MQRQVTLQEDCHMDCMNRMQKEWLHLLAIQVAMIQLYAGNDCSSRRTIPAQLGLVVQRHKDTANTLGGTVT